MRRCTPYFFYFGLIFFLAISTARAQQDTLIFKNGEIVTGEIKLLKRGTVIMETSYSDSDFQIDWLSVSTIKSNQTYIITTDDGRRIYASLNSIGNSDSVLMYDGSDKHYAALLDIVSFKPVFSTFWDKFSANIDFGLNSTKANNLIQFNTNLAAGYLTKKYAVSGAFNRVFSRQDSISDTKRTDGNIKIIVLLRNRWYVFLSNDFLQNDEQKLDLRSNTKIGLGQFVIESQELYLALFAGAASNNERYIENVNPDRFTTEAFAGIEFNMFDAGDLSMRTNATAYPNLSESGRLRIDFDFEIKYNLPRDFYLKGRTTLNYDNSPVDGASELAYVYNTGFGWKW